MQVAVLEVAQPECLQAAVEGEHGLDPIHKRLEHLLQWGHQVSQRHISNNLRTRTDFLR